MPELSVDALTERDEVEQLTTVMNKLDSMLRALHWIYPWVMERVRMGPLLRVKGIVIEVL